MTAAALAHVRRVRVGSMNEPKIQAARGALRAYLPRARVEGASVESGISEQPVGLDEIARGARVRAERAFELGDCELAVGYEDGLVDFWKTARERKVIRTASADQVIQKLYTSSKGRWTRYSALNDGILEPLEPWRKHFGYA